MESIHVYYTEAKQTSFNHTSRTWVGFLLGLNTPVRAVQGPGLGNLNYSNASHQLPFFDGLSSWP